MTSHGSRSAIALTVLALLGGACSRHDATGLSADLLPGEAPLTIAIDPPSATLAPSQAQQFTATVYTPGGPTIARAEATWSSTDQSVASVTSSGLVTALHDGVTYIGAAFGPGRDSARVVVESRFLRNVIIYTTEEFGLPEIAIVHPDGSGRQRLTTDQAAYASPTISPDGRRIAVASHRGATWEIDLMNADASGVSVLVARSSFDGSPAWSPNGAQIAFRSVNVGPFGQFGRIFVINVDGTGLRQLSPDTPNYTYDDGPTWSPNGSRIVFTRNGVLQVINADGTGLAALPTGPGLAGYPAWSPDGTHIAYAAQDQNADLFIVNADGSNPVNLTPGLQQAQFPRWSPDGRRLVFARAINQVFQLFLIGADGTGEVKLSSTAASEGTPSWSPVP
jgi:Tol biopolymer transport system component